MCGVNSEAQGTLDLMTLEFYMLLDHNTDWMARRI
jgi:hypothetical protein